MQRRQFISLLGSAALAMPHTARAQQLEPMRRIGVLMGYSEGHSASQARLEALRDIDPVRMMRPRLAEPIRASSPSGLHQRAGHMTASDLCAVRQKVSCSPGAIHT
jgi:hypothetical protein